MRKITGIIIIIHNNELSLSSYYYPIDKQCFLILIQYVATEKKRYKKVFFPIILRKIINSNYKLLQNHSKPYKIRKGDK